MYKILSKTKLAPGRIILIILLIAVAWEILDGYLTNYNSLQDSIIDVLMTVGPAIIMVI